MTFAHQQLRSYVNRVTRINDDIKSLNSDKSEVYKEAKGNGFDPKVLKAAVKRYTQLQEDRLGVEEFDAILELYMEALLGSGASDDQGASKSPPAASASPAIGIVKSPTRVHAREPLPDGVIIEPASAPSDAEAGQGDDAERQKASFGTPALQSSSVALASEEGADAIALDAPSSPSHSPSGELTATGSNGGSHAHGVASTAHKSSDTRRSFEQDPGRALGSDPVSEVAAIAPASAAIAPVEPSPSHDNAPGASFPCEANGWAGLEPLPQFDRRRPAA